MAAAASCNCGFPHLFLLLLDSSPPRTRPWGAGPPAGTSSPLGPVGTSCRLPGRGLRGRRVSRPLAWCPGLAARSPCWRGAPLAPTDSETERRCLAAPRQRAIGRPGAGRGRRGRDVGGSEPWKSSRFVQITPGKARCETEQRVPLRRQRDLGGAGWRPREPALSILLRLRPRGWSRLGAGHWSAFPLPQFSKPHLHGAAGSGRATLAPDAEPMPGQAALSRSACCRGPGRDGRERAGVQPRAP